MAVNNNLGILVVSCDKYSDLWPVFFKQFWKYWGECKYKVYLGSNYIDCKDDKVKTIKIGEDYSWSSSVKNMLSSINEEYILMLLEDFFFDKKVDTNRIERLFEYVVNNHVDCLRLKPSPPAYKITNKELKIGDIEKWEPYYVSTQPAIWKKSVLIELLKEGYSPWDFEVKNSSTSRLLDYHFMCTSDKVISFHNGVERGQYYRSTILFLNKEGIAVDSSKRGIVDDLKFQKRFDKWISKTRKYVKIKFHIE